LIATKTEVDTKGNDASQTYRTATVESSSANAAQHTAQWYHQSSGSDAAEPWIALASNDVVYGEASSTAGNVADVASLNGFNVYVGY